MRNPGSGAGTKGKSSILAKSLSKTKKPSASTVHKKSKSSASSSTASASASKSTASTAASTAASGSSSIPQGKRKAANDKLAASINESVDDVRAVYNSVLQRHKRDEMAIERSMELKRKEAARRAEALRATQEADDMDAALAALSAL